eukprot:Sdes_comp16879_c0_seq1m6104
MSTNIRMLILRNVLILVCLFMTSLYLLSLLVSLLVGGNHQEEALRFPSTFEEIKSNIVIFHKYKASNFPLVLLLFSCAYLFKQTFAVPGSALLNIIAGSVFGLNWALPLTCILTACGATFCYLLSWFLGKPIVEYFFSQSLSSLKVRLSKRKTQLLPFLIFIRSVPFTPNWFVNVASPLMGISIYPFFVSTLMGLLPYNYVCCHAGILLSELESLEDVFDVWTLMKMLFISLVYISPKLFQMLYSNRPTLD